MSSVLNTLASTLLFLLAQAVCVAATLPPEFAEALANFRAEGAKGWSFVQKTTADGESVVERFDPALPDFKRWTLLQKNGRAPTESDLRSYNETQTRRSSGFNAPRIQDQLDLSGGKPLSADAHRAVWQFPLKPGGDDDTTARAMGATITVDLRARAVVEVELATVAPFSPALWIRIEESRTVMSYSLPEEKRPSLLQRVTLHVRGRAFWVKSLNQNMEIQFSEHAWAGKKPL